MNAANPDLWTAFIGFLYSRRDHDGQVGTFARYALRRWDQTRSDWRRDRSDFSGKDLFGCCRRDWGDRLAERAIRAAIKEFLDFLWARATGADGGPRNKH